MPASTVCSRWPFSSDWRSRSVICRSTHRGAGRGSRPTTGSPPARSRSRRCRPAGRAERPAAEPDRPGARAGRCAARVSAAGAGRWRRLGQRKAGYSRERGDPIRRSSLVSIPHAARACGTVPAGGFPADESYSPVLRCRRCLRRGGGSGAGRPAAPPACRATRVRGALPRAGPQPRARPALHEVGGQRLTLLTFVAGGPTGGATALPT